MERSSPPHSPLIGPQASTGPRASGAGIGNEDSPCSFSIGS
jgi:hypothetical protein